MTRKTTKYTRDPEGYGTNKGALTSVKRKTILSE